MPFFCIYYPISVKSLRELTLPMCGLNSGSGPGAKCAQTRRRAQDGLSCPRPWGGCLPLTGWELCAPGPPRNPLCSHPQSGVPASSQVEVPCTNEHPSKTVSPLLYVPHTQPDKVATELRMESNRIKLVPCVILRTLTQEPKIKKNMYLIAVNLQALSQRLKSYNQ